MGHGWKEVGRYNDKRKCKCGKGLVYTPVIEEESDYSSSNREERHDWEAWSDCPDNCENKNK